MSIKNADRTGITTTKWGGEKNLQQTKWGGEKNLQQQADEIYTDEMCKLGSEIYDTCSLI